MFDTILTLNNFILNLHIYLGALAALYRINNCFYVNIFSIFFGRLLEIVTPQVSLWWRRLSMLLYESQRFISPSIARTYGLTGALRLRTRIHGIARLCCLSPFKVGGEWGPETDKRSKTLLSAIETFRNLRPSRGSFRPGRWTQAENIWESDS